MVEKLTNLTQVIKEALDECDPPTNPGTPLVISGHIKIDGGLHIHMNELGRGDTWQP